MTNLLWPANHVLEALSALTNTEPSRQQTTDILAAAATLNLEAQPVEIRYNEFDRQFRKLGPAIVRTPNGLLAVTRGGKILTPNKQEIKLPAETIRAMLCADQELQLETLLQLIPAAERSKARDAIVRERLGSTRIRGIYQLRLPPGSDFRKQLRQSAIPQKLGALIIAHAIQYILWIAAWWIVGKNVLNPHADRRWLLTWAMLLLTLVPFRVAITWLQGKVAIGVGALLKRRLFYGALRLDPDSIRHQGAGQLLGRVIESEAVEALALSGGFLGLVAVIELFVSLFVLGAGAVGILHVSILLGWIAIGASIGRRYLRNNRAWTDQRLAITHDLVESMVGHRTRIAQVSPDRWHDGEDEALRRYIDASKPMDRATTALLAIVPRGWLVLGLLLLAPAYMHAATTAQIAISLGGILLAYRALKRLAAGAWQIAGAAVAWDRVSVLYNSATRPEVRGALEITERETPSIVDARDLVFRYNNRGEPVLRGCNLEVAHGDRLVLEGPSGGGKSTLVSLLAGVREPNTGQLLVTGLDRKTLGLDRWIQRIAAAPQFHENHVLAETFAFNLLMGRHTEPALSDLEEAEEICRELGLGELLERMPAGMLQMVGETGWQLSHGERSRLYIARALLQNSELVILDESFAALDPENLQRCVECVVRRARSLLVVAHR